MPSIQDWMEDVKEGLKCYMYHRFPIILHENAKNLTNFSTLKAQLHLQLPRNITNTK